MLWKRCIVKSNTIKTENYWATPIWSTEIEGVNNEDLVRFVLNEQKQSPEIVERSNKGGWQSRANLQTDIEMGGLCREISNVCFSLWPNFRKMGIAQMWAAINKKNDWNIIHQHGQYEISGGYYLRVPENSGKIVFRDPAPQRINYCPVYQLILGYDLLFNQPKEHDLVMWPSYLDHFVEPSKSDEDRIMISFDLKIDA